MVVNKPICVECGTERRDCLAYTKTFDEKYVWVCPLCWVTFEYGFYIVDPLHYGTIAILR